MSDTGAATTAGTYSNSPVETNRDAGPAADSGGSNGNSGQITTAVGGLMSAYAAFSSGQYNSRVAKFNAQQARIRAAQAMEAAQFKENQLAAREKVAAGAERSSFAGQGVVVGAGTSRAVIDSSKNVTAMDQMLVDINARRQAYGYAVEAADQTARGDFAQRTGDMKAVASLIDTSAQLDLQGDRTFKGRTVYGNN